MKVSDIPTCYACRACEDICPHDALQFKKDTLSGILFPVIDDKSCLNCSACYVKCITKLDSAEPRKAYILESKEMNDLMQCSSGGAFYEIAALFIDNYGGYVFGAEYDQELNICHNMYNNKEGIKRFRKSKYVQSITDGIFPSIREKLESGEYVLFSGTPCQVAGLRKYLKKKYDTLFTIDLICTGVMAPSIYYKFLSQYNINEIDYFDWRYKHSEPDGKFNIMDSAMIMKDGSIQQNKGTTQLKRLYGKKIGYKQSCYTCEYASIRRYGDITLGDYWSEKSFFRNEVNKGSSAVIVNTEKGKIILDKLLSKIDLYIAEIDIQKIINQNPALTKPTSCPNKNSNFWNDFSKGKDIKFLLNKYTKDRITGRLKMAIADVLPESIVRMIQAIKRK